MRLVTHVQSGEERLAALADDQLVDLNRSAASLARSSGTPDPKAFADAMVGTDVVTLLTLGEPGLKAAAAAVEHATGLDPSLASRELLISPVDNATLLPPVPRPPKILCVARNYAKHAEEAGLELSEIPIMFSRFANTLVAEGRPIIRPTVSDELDWEAELAVVIGVGGGHIAKEHAMNHVAGYSILNDVTVRPYQFRTSQYTAGKNFRGSAPFGPHLVLKDEIPNPHALDIRLTINGIEKQNGNTSDMIFDVPTIIEHISEWIDLEVGDVIAMGTPDGVGFKRQPPEFLQPGDQVVIDLEGVGTLTNPVVAEESM
jgi:2-keto-4-pentenoate hydratase/2-oxohepta-3-ene-1,7-dioic acid hydratase in catechol pathway